MVLGARRAAFTDADFYRLDTSQPIIIDVTVGDLPRELLDLEGYIRFIRGYDSVFQEVEDEPSDGSEPAITLRLKVGQDCEPTWSLFSQRLADDELPRDIRSDHRALISAQRLGATVAQHLAWGPRSVLTRLSDGSSGLAAVLASANRAARAEFDIDEASDLKPAVAAAKAVAKEMAVAGGLKAVAALDARAVNVSNGAVALHDADGVPLRALGTGSSRLMAAGLQAAAAAKVPILLLDEAEHGLEPHRIARLLHKLGSKYDKPIQQVFLTTHSPVVMRELSANQLWVARPDVAATLELKSLRNLDDAPGLLRSHPEAFLSPTVLVCEGATEVGLCRGVDLHETEQGRDSLALHGVALVDGGGDRQWQTALGLAGLGFRVGLFRDSDVLSELIEQSFLQAGGTVFAWDADCAFEDQLFTSISLSLIPSLFVIADKHRSREVVDQSLGSAGFPITEWQRLRDSPLDADRPRLAKAAKAKKTGWFKRIDIAEELGRTVIAPNLFCLEEALGSTFVELLVWLRGEAASGDA